MALPRSFTSAPNFPGRRVAGVGIVAADPRRLITSIEIERVDPKGFPRLHVLRIAHGLQATAHALPSFLSSDLRHVVAPALRGST